MSAYLPKGTRIVTIMHLCWIFTYFCWLCGSPFIQDHLTFKKKLMVLKTVQGHQDLTVGASDEDVKLLVPKLERHAMRFSQLESTVQDEIRHDYEALLQAPGRGWYERCSLVGSSLIYGVPPFLQAYLVLSLVVCFFLLFRIEGGAQAACLLPVLLLVYSVNSQAYGLERMGSPDAKLFPTEEALIERYIPEGLLPNINAQFAQLKEAWKNYLIEDWAKKEIPADETKRDLLVEQGEFAFSLAQIKALNTPAKKASFQRSAQERGYPLLQLMGLSWTAFFAFYVNRKQALNLSPD